MIVRSLPIAMQVMSLDSFEFGRVEDRPAFKDMLTRPEAGYLLVGPYGTGKTHLLVGLYVETSLKPGKTLLCSSRQIMEWLTDEARFQKTKLMTLAKGKEPFHLFWDDIDKMKETESRQEMLFALLDSMYIHGHRLTATANTRLQNLDKTNVITPALMRRIDEMIKKQVSIISKV